MKFYLSQITSLLTKIENEQIKALLLYGPDKGYIDKIIHTLIKKFNLLKTTIEYSELKTSSTQLLANTPNFFKRKQLIKIRTVGESIDKALKLALGQESLHFLVFIADELPATASIRKFFETENYLASVGCYHDEPHKITQIILSKFAKVGKVIREDAVQYLVANLPGDHQAIIQEIEKLIYFTHDQPQVTKDDAQAVITAGASGNGDDLCWHFSLTNLSGFLQEFKKLKHQNINEVLIIRALIRYYLNLYIVLNKIENGINVEIAIKSLTPPIFYKNIVNFKKSLNKVSIAECERTLKYLQQAEIDYKLNPAGFDIYTQIYARNVL